jgi:tyrosine-protein kinase Etk/Wzc
MSQQIEILITERLGAATTDEIHLLDLVVILAEKKWLVILAPIVTGALALLISVLLAPVYTSTAKIMPPQQQSSGISAMLGQLGGLAGAVGGIGGAKSASDTYLGVLESRTVADNLIRRFKLSERYAKETMEDTRKVLTRNSSMATGKKDGFILITVDDHNAQFAADLANAYVDELSKLTSSLALTEAAQRRVFFEGQLKEAKDQLANAEVVLRTTQEKTGMIQPAAQVSAIITNASQLKGTIAAKEVQIQAMRTFAAGQNPELLRALEELQGLKSQLAKLETNQTGSQGDFMVPTAKIPEVGVEYVRGVRNVKYYETMFELLAKQYELAKIDEAKESSMIQVLDKAIASERPSRPNRVLFTLAGILVGTILGLILAFSQTAYARSRDNPASKRRWQLLSQAWHGGKSSKTGA